jgi:hypothetical protein
VQRRCGARAFFDGCIGCATAVGKWAVRLGGGGIPEAFGWFFLPGGAASGLSGGLPSDGLAGDS